MNDQLKNIPNI